MWPICAKGQARVGHHQQGHAMGQGGQLLAGDHQAGLGHGKGVGIFGVAEQRNVAALRALQRSHITQLDVGRAFFGLGADAGGDFGQRERPGALVKSVVGHAAGSLMEARLAANPGTGTP